MEQNQHKPAAGNMYNCVQYYIKTTYAARVDKPFHIVVTVNIMLIFSRRNGAVYSAQTVCCYEISSTLRIQSKQSRTCLADASLRTLFTVSVWSGCKPLTHTEQ